MVLQRNHRQGFHELILLGVFFKTNLTYKIRSTKGRFNFFFGIQTPGESEVNQLDVI